MERLFLGEGDDPEWEAYEQAQRFSLTLEPTAPAGVAPESIQKKNSQPQPEEVAAVGAATDGDEAPAEPGAPAQAQRARGKSQYFLFTLNLGKQEARASKLVNIFAFYVEQLFVDEEIAFYSCGHEVAPNTGEHHIQGYFETPKGQRWTYAKAKALSMFNFPGAKPVWIKAAGASAEDNIRYTGKAVDEGRWYDCKGIFRNFGQGKSKDLVRVQQKLDARVPLSSIYQDHFETSAKHFRFFKEYAATTGAKRTDTTQVHYIYGPTGTGKSRYCLAKWGSDPQRVYWLSMPKAGGNVWWDGYQGQETVIIDDFYPGYFGKGHYQFMLRLVDRYPFQVPVHGGQVNFCAKTIVFTSNTGIDQIDAWDGARYPWDPTNPLYSRVYLREPKWIIVPMLGDDRNPQGSPPPRPPPVPPTVVDTRGERVAVLEHNEAAQRVAKRLRTAKSRYYDLLRSQALFDE